MLGNWSKKCLHRSKASLIQPNETVLGATLKKIASLKRLVIYLLLFLCHYDSMKNHVVLDDHGTDREDEITRGHNEK